MSQGARKRAYLGGSLDRLLWPDGITTDDLERESASSWSEIRTRRPMLGTNLRPCPGNGCRRKQTWCIRCDGNGVEPARKARKAIR